jgi:hypothetical protein
LNSPRKREKRQSQKGKGREGRGEPLYMTKIGGTQFDVHETDIILMYMKLISY